MPQRPPVHPAGHDERDASTRHGPSEAHCTTLLPSHHDPVDCPLVWHQFDAQALHRPAEHPAEPQSRSKATTPQAP